LIQIFEFKFKKIQTNSIKKVDLDQKYNLIIQI